MDGSFVNHAAILQVPNGKGIPTPAKIQRCDSVIYQQFLRKKIEDIGGGGFLTCTKNVTEAISGVGPFGEVEEAWLPATLDNQLRSLGKHVGEANDVQSLRRLMAKKGRLGVNE